jgi:hypothetical protein
MIRYIKNWIIDNAQEWLLNKFLDRMKVSDIVKAIITMDSLFVLRTILTKYGLGFLTNYVVLISML